MTVTITGPMVIAGISGVTVLCAFVVKIFQTYTKAYNLVKHQEEQDKQIKALEEKHDAQNKIINEDLKAVTSALLACLQGLHEQGCNGPVTAAISALQNHINNRAHK